MEEKRLEHPEERQDEKQEKKKQYPVTRRDFYGCVIILLIAIFLQGIQTRALIRRGNTQLENSMANRISSVESRIENIPNSIETALLEADNPFRESSVEIAAADLKAKKVTLRMTAMPKEWKTGDTSLQFYLSCDGGEKIAVDAAAGADHSFTAEKEIPFCEVAAVTAILQRGDTEYPFDLGETSVAGVVYPFFSGDFFWQLFMGSCWQRGNGRWRHRCRGTAERLDDAEGQEPDAEKSHSRDLCGRKTRTEA